MLRQLLNDEAGFIVSAELVLIATIVVIGLVVGLSEVQHSINNELNDVAEAIGSLNQSFYFEGMGARKGNGFKSLVVGSSFADHVDQCDGNECDLSCDIGAAPEQNK